MRYLAAAALATGLMAAGAASADVEPIYFITGNDALRLCKHDGLFCTSFVSGALDMAAALSPKDVSFCLPKDVTGQQMADVFVKALTLDPEHRDKPAVFLFLQHLEEVYPCPR